MKKTTAIFIAILLIISSISNTFAQTLLLSYDGKEYKYTGAAYSIKVNGGLVNSEMPSIVLNKIVYIPVRGVYEELGAEVVWDANAQKMTVKLEGSTMVFKQNSSSALVNGSSIKLLAAAKKINQRLMIPVGFLKDTLDAKITLSTKDGVVNIDTPAQLKDVSFTASGNSERVSILLDRHKQYSIMRISEPDRLVVDIPDVKVPEKAKKIEVDSKLVKTLRYSQFEEDSARVVLDLAGQVQFQTVENGGQLNLVLTPSTFKNISYSNSSDRVYFSLKGAKLTEGGEKLKKLYTGKYDATGKRYTVTFPSYLADVGFGTIQIYDKMLNTVQITKSPDGKNTQMVFSAKDKFVYEIIRRYDTNDTAITILKPAAKQDKLVVIDPGHGGFDPGATYSGINEKDLNLDIALRLNKLLKLKKVKTFMLREDDSYLGLYERAYIANSLNAALFLSIHNNAIDNPNFGGSMTLYYPPGINQKGFTAKRFAQIIQGKLVGSLKTTDRSIIQRPELVVLNATSMPAALAEVAFMTNKPDLNNLKKPEFRQKAAAALCDSIVQALGEMK